jgi:hypothetical protein
LAPNALRRRLDWLALQWWFSSGWLSKAALSDLCVISLRGYLTEYLFHAWAKHANHHLLEHAQEGHMMLAHDSFCSFPKSLQNLFFLLKGCGVRFPWQQNPGHFRLKVWNATSVLLELHPALQLELVSSVFQLLQLLWR